MNRNKAIGLSITAAVIGSLAIIGAVAPSPDAKTAVVAKTAASTEPKMLGEVDVNAMLAAANKAGAEEDAAAVDSYAATYHCGKTYEGLTWLCADGWVVAVKLTRNYFGYAEAKGGATRAFGNDTTAWVNVTLTRGRVDVAQMSGIVSNYSGKPQIFNLTGADSIDGGKYKMSMHVTSY